MKENKLVNWQNNMKISSAHFTQTENHFIEESINSRHVFLQKDEYGLLPAINEKYELDLEIRTTVSGQVEIALRNCFAITKSGGNPVIVTEIIEVSDAHEMSFNPYYVKSETVFELQTYYTFKSKEYPIDEGRETRLNIITQEYTRLEDLEVSKSG